VVEALGTRRRSRWPARPRETILRRHRVSTRVGKRVNLIMSSTTTCRGSEFGIVGQEPVWTGVRGSGVKAASPATAGAERSDAP